MKMNKQKGFGVVAIVAIIAIALAGGAGYYVYKNSNTASNDTTKI